VTSESATDGAESGALGATEWGTRIGDLPHAHERRPSDHGVVRPARCRRHRDKERIVMKRFMIEREIPRASDLTQTELTEIARASNEVVASLGVPYNWVTSYVAGDKVYCVHEAENMETILEHARRGCFPADTVSVVSNEFGPHSAEG
jgi:Nickel responsive protein SCO4226-like